MEELKPCPFCARKPENVTDTKRIGCTGFTCILFGLSFDVEAWNTRPLEDAAEARAEKAEAELDSLESKLAGHTAALRAAGKEIGEWKALAKRHQRERDSITKMFDERSDQAQEWRKRAEQAESDLSDAMPVPHAQEEVS